jgi:hypothetical protein
MKRMLLINSDEQVWISIEQEQSCEESTQRAHQFKANEQHLAANPLPPVMTETAVRLRDRKPLVTDGPFAETHEQLGG